MGKAMKVAVISATGKAGRLIAKEAFDRGMEVTAIVRDRQRLDTDQYGVIQRDIMDITLEDIFAFDAVVCAFGSDPGRAEVYPAVLSHLTEVFEQAPAVRLLVVGGAASLYTDETESALLITRVPAEWLAVPTSMLKAFEALKKSKANWTFFSPANTFDPEGPRTERYTLGTDYVIPNRRGESYISYSDYAIAMVDEIEKGRFIGRRFTAVSERQA